MDPNKYEYNIQSISRDKTKSFWNRRSLTLIASWIGFYCMGKLLLGKLVLGKLVTGEVSVGEISGWGNCCWGSCDWGNCVGEVALGK